MSGNNERSATASAVFVLLVFLTFLTSAPGVCWGITGWLHRWGIIDIRSGVDGLVHLFGGLVAPVATLFALIPLTVMVLGTRGYVRVKVVTAVFVALSVLLTYVFRMNYIY